MKIAVIADVLGEENNGTTITVKRLIHYLKARGHEVYTVCPNGVPEDGFFFVDTIDFKMFNNYVKKNGVELAKPNEKLLTEIISKCDVVHVLMPFALGRAAVRICKQLNKPCTTAFHVQPENVSSHFGMQKSKFINNCIYSNFLKGFYNYSEYIHCPTEFIANQLREHGYTQDLRIISNGVDPVFVPEKRTKPAEYADKFCILTTGRFVKEKCQKDLIRAASLSRHADQIQLFIAGEGPLENKLREAAQILKNPPVIGFHPKQELAQIINFCDLYVHPSYAEIESIACVEAITCGLIPVICNSKMSAAKYFALDYRNLYRAGDPKALAYRIDYMIEHPEFRDAQRSEYIRYGERFRIEKCIDKMEKLFEDAIAGRHVSQSCEETIADCEENSAEQNAFDQIP